jgi:hypothetical protein
MCNIAYIPIRLPCNVARSRSIHVDDWQPLAHFQAAIGNIGSACDAHNNKMSIQPRAVLSRSPVV